MNLKLVLGLVLGGLVVLFLVQNVGVVEIRFFIWSFFISRSLLLFIVLAIGVIIGWSWHSLSLRKKRHEEPRRDI